MNQTHEEKVAATKARMAELAAKFIERSARELDAMRAALAKLATGAAPGEEPGALGEIRHLAHRMCGTGATLGFEALADCAAHIEQLSESGATGIAPGAQVHTQLSAAIDALGAELARLDAASKRPPGA